MRVLAILGTVASVVTGVGSMIYVLGDPEGYSLYFRAKYLAHLWTVRIHGLFACLTLLLGPYQLWRPGGRYHRLVGVAYLVSVLLASVTGFRMGLLAEGGPISQAGYCVMASLWCFTGFKAWQAARAKDFPQHRVWVIRNFALASGAIVLRFYLQGAQMTGYLFEEMYTSAVWVCWVPCLVVAELLLTGSSSEPANGSS